MKEKDLVHNISNGHE
jgi:hypothetical protein